MFNVGDKYSGYLGALPVSGIIIMRIQCGQPIEEDKNKYQPLELCILTGWNTLIRIRDRDLML